MVLVHQTTPLATTRLLPSHHTFASPSYIQFWYIYFLAMDLKGEFFKDIELPLLFSPHEDISATFLTRFPLYGLHNHHTEPRLKHILPYFYQSQPYFHHFTTFLLHLNQISTMYATLPWHSTIFLPYSIIFPPFYHISATHQPSF